MKFLFGVAVGSYLGRKYEFYKTALRWAKKHPNDPVAADILERFEELKKGWVRLKNFRLHKDFEDIMKRNDLD